MGQWTHRFCERCWFDGPQSYVQWPDERIPGIIHEGPNVGGYRMPSQVQDPETGKPEAGACCGCGGMTITGIYVRADENDLLCRGEHGNVGTWSRVIPTHPGDTSVSKVEG